MARPAASLATFTIIKLYRKEPLWSGPSLHVPFFSAALAPVSWTLGINKDRPERGSVPALLEGLSFHSDFVRQALSHTGANFR